MSVVTGVSPRFQLPLSGSHVTYAVHHLNERRDPFNSLSRDHLPKSQITIGIAFFQLPLSGSPLGLPSGVIIGEGSTFNSLSRDHGAGKAVDDPGLLLITFNSLSRDHLRRGQVGGGEVASDVSFNSLSRDHSNL